MCVLLLLDCTQALEETHYRLIANITHEWLISTYNFVSFLFSNLYSCIAVSLVTPWCYEFINSPGMLLLLLLLVHPPLPT